jgi:hypothetical protein
LRGVFLLRRITYLAAAALVAMLILVPSALAQDAVPAGDDDPFVPEQNATLVAQEDLEQIAGTPTPAEPTQPPVPDVAAQSLPTTGGTGIGALSMMLPASALLLLGSSALTYAVLRRR